MSNVDDLLKKVVQHQTRGLLTPEAIAGTAFDLGDKTLRGDVPTSSRATVSISIPVEDTMDMLALVAEALEGAVPEAPKPVQEAVKPAAVAEAPKPVQEAVKPAAVAEAPKPVQEAVKPASVAAKVEPETQAIAGSIGNGPAAADYDPNDF